MNQAISNQMHWTVYNDLAWVEPIICSVEDEKEACLQICAQLKSMADGECGTMLHLGCGAGYYDAAFKEQFRVTGVDISPGMLELAKGLNPQVNYIKDDMRSLRLGERFDAVVIPDAIDYMLTGDDLSQALATAHDHLRPGGLLMINSLLQDLFEENNFVYAGSKDGVEVTIFENNYSSDLNPDQYEAVFCYLIRRAGKLEIHSERHVLGLFSRDYWHRSLEEIGFRIIQTSDSAAYEESNLGQGQYIRTNFIAQKI